MASSTYDYFLETDFSDYSGEWIGLLGSMVVAHGSTFKEVAEIVDREFKSKKVLITRVPPKMAQLL